MPERSKGSLLHYRARERLERSVILPEGDKAKKFVEKLLPAGSGIVIHSEKTRTEKWGRFLADIFYLKPNSSPEDVIEEGVYLNQRLLDEGYAVRMEE